MKAIPARDMQKIVWVLCVNCRSLAVGMDQKCLALTNATKKNLSTICSQSEWVCHNQCVNLSC